MRAHGCNLVNTTELILQPTWVHNPNSKSINRSVQPFLHSWQQSVIGHIGATWRTRLNLCFLWPTRVHNPNYLIRAHERKRQTDRIRLWPYHAMHYSASRGKNYNYSNNWEIFIISDRFHVYADHTIDSAWPGKKSKMSHGCFVCMGKTLTGYKFWTVNCTRPTIALPIPSSPYKGRGGGEEEGKGWARV